LYAKELSGSATLCLRFVVDYLFTSEALI